MTQIKEHRPGAGDHQGDADQSRAGAVNPDLIPRQRQRSSDSWADRHRSRVNRIFNNTTDQRTDEDHWSASELMAFELAAEHLRALGLYGGWQCPESARRAWRCQRCPCQREAA
jgi:hypothetical protein